jgi:hypothetical protein
MLVLDSEAQVRMTKAAGHESSAAIRQKAMQQEIESNTVTVALDAGRPVNDLQAQLGKPLTSQQVQDKLKQANPNLIFERSIAYPELTGVYLKTWERNATGALQEIKKHLFGMESGIMPEFSVRHITRKRVPNPELFGRKEATREVDWIEVETFLAETRGWRTVLVRLLHMGLINRWHVEKHFGWNPSKESENWHTQLK